MKYIYFEWDDGNEYKIMQRASLEEVESAFYDRKKKKRRTFFNRYVILARTSIGRYLHIVCQRKAGGVIRVIRVISVRDMTDSEKRRYWRK